MTIINNVMERRYGVFYDVVHIQPGEFPSKITAFIMPCGSTKPLAETNMQTFSQLPYPESLIPPTRLRVTILRGELRDVQNFKLNVFVNFTVSLRSLWSGVVSDLVLEDELLKTLSIPGREECLSAFIEALNKGSLLFGQVAPEVVEIGAREPFCVTFNSERKFHVEHPLVFKVSIEGVHYRQALEIG